MIPHKGFIVGGLYFFMPSAHSQGEHQRHRLPASAQVCFDYYYSMRTLEGVTLLLALGMLGAVWAQWHVGILGFPVWLTLYDVALLLINSLLQVQMQAVGLKLSLLLWYG
ncbi:unnamed protein product [Coregonus sp. 'balchen']|nr:unnamed protein product [Coregonus sp. 'balchen']